MGYTDQIVPKAITIQCKCWRQKITDPEEIVNSFNNFVATIVEKYLPDSQNTPSNHSNLKILVKSKIDPSDKFNIPLIIEEKVTKLITNLKENKALGFYFRLALPSLLVPILNIKNAFILMIQKWNWKRLSAKIYTGT